MSTTSPEGIAPPVAPSAPPDAQDLNALVSPDKPVLFGRPPIAYTIPGDFPMDLYIMAQQALVTDDEVEGTNLLHQSLKGLLGYYLDPAENESTLRQLDRDVRRLGVRTMLTLINSIYKDDDEEIVEAADVDPPVAAPVPEVPQPSALTTTTTSSSPEE